MFVELTGCREMRARPLDVLVALAGGVNCLVTVMAAVVVPVAVRFRVLCAVFASCV